MRPLFPLTSLLNTRALALLAAASAPAFFLAGCGGGGGNGPSTPNPTVAPTTGPTTEPTITPTTTPTTGPTTPPTGGTLFDDDFTSANFDTAKWRRYTNPQELQRARFGSLPTNINENGVSFARISLDSYNSDAPGQFYRGTEIFTPNSFAVGSGLEVEARLRGPISTPGIVFAFFLINDRYIGTPSADTYRKSEIDFEFLTSQQEQFAGNKRNRLYTNIWNDWNQPRDGFDSNDVNDNRVHDDKVYQPSLDPNYDFAGWNTYKIRWYPDRTEYYVNNRLERTEREVRPDEAMSLHFNIWVPNPDFNQAFSSNLLGPVATADNPNRRVYSFDVDYVRVKSLTSGATAARIAGPNEAAKPLPAYLKSYRNR